MTNKLFYGDNLDVLRDEVHFPNASVDLIYLDPALQLECGLQCAVQGGEAPFRAALSGRDDDEIAREPISGQNLNVRNRPIADIPPSGRGPQHFWLSAHPAHNPGRTGSGAVEEELLIAVGIIVERKNLVRRAEQVVAPNSVRQRGTIVADHVHRDESTVAVGVRDRGGASARPVEEKIFVAVAVIVES